MISGFEQISKTMSHTENDSDTESGIERDFFTEYPQGTSAERIKADQEKWKSCHNWDSAVELNRQFFSGELEFNILDLAFDPKDMANGVLQSLLEIFYIIWHQPCSFRKLYAPDGGTLITRRMGSCCFMLSHQHRLLVPLINALLDSQQLHTVVMYDGDTDLTQGSVYNFDREVRTQDCKSRSTSAYLDPWSLFETESPEEVHSELFKLWEKIHGLDCHALTSSNPILFRVRAREYGTDILDLLFKIFKSESNRHSLSYVIGSYKLVRK
jgi:hypothetical protein